MTKDKGCLVDEFEECCLGDFNIRVGEKVFEKMCKCV